MAGLPELLTVEEAARLIRVGRTKAYAMTREWRATEGRSGLPVVDFGHVLRVPRHAIEELIGAQLDGAEIAATHVVSGRGDIGGAGAAAPAAPLSNGTSPTKQHGRGDRSSMRRTSSSRRASVKPSNQLDLFKPSTVEPRA